MKAYIASDLHWDDWYHGGPKTPEAYINGWVIPKEVSWNGKEIETPGLLRKEEAIIVAGDIANTYEDWAKMVAALSKNYKEVVIVPGNHDLTVDWGDEKKFKTTEEKLEAYKKYVKYYPNVHFLDGEVIKIGNTTIGGCMGMWDTSFYKHSYFSQFFPDEQSAVKTADSTWKKWFDCHHWKYLGNDIAKIKEVEFSKMEKCLEQKPDIMVTHFCPFPGEAKIPYEYRKSKVSTFFYFDESYSTRAKIWIAGHTHTPYHKIGPNENVFVNPIGYFAENNNDLAKNDKWVIEL